MLAQLFGVPIRRALSSLGDAGQERVAEGKKPPRQKAGQVFVFGRRRLQKRLAVEEVAPPSIGSGERPHRELARRRRHLEASFWLERNKMDGQGLGRVGGEVQEEEGEEAGEEGPDHSQSMGCFDPVGQLLVGHLGLGTAARLAAFDTGRRGHASAVAARLAAAPLAAAAG